MKKIAVLAITKNGIKMSLRIKEYFSDFEIFAPIKFSDNNEKIQWYDESTTRKIVDLFKWVISQVILLNNVQNKD